MCPINIQYHKTPIGQLVLGSFDEKLCMCDWLYRTKRQTVDNRLLKRLNAPFLEESSEVISIAKQQLGEYFDAKRKQFSVPLLMIGTDFQKQVWSELVKIPFGKTFSYLELAESINNKKAVRAVASANGANAISIFIPCHRIIGRNGQLTGYAGGLPAKEALLKLEQGGI